ncbi:3'-5' exonuclease [Seonamhaeicola sp.]|uniref:3'-5' exonuclease n=1 Tax=Seonamhaeicola sp. TaxID=1912245 RepID=UPI00356953E1
MENTHISFDLETLGKTSNAPIVQIAAVKFKTNGEIIDTFSRTIDIEDLEQYNLQPDYSTILWWLNQDKEAINQVFGNYSIKTTLKIALCNFSNWIGADEDFHFWSHATNDPPILKANFKAVDIELPIYYRSFKDLRTLNEMAGNPIIKREGTHHVAIDDALYQKDCIVECFKILNYNI